MPTDPHAAPELVIVRPEAWRPTDAAVKALARLLLELARQRLGTPVEEARPPATTGKRTKRRS
ncbi:MAG TPA: hypothetical protein VKE94_22660 [Gemmataceae bacterium]|nr:hypothetical protein [Gemmataceae bacterium]